MPDWDMIYVSRGSGKVLDVRQGSLAPGVPALQWTFHGSLSQKWNLVYVRGEDAYRIHPHGASGDGQNLCLEVRGASRDDGAIIQLWTPNGGTHQLWRFAGVEEHITRIQAVHSGKVLDVRGRSQEDGADVIQWEDWGGWNQHWIEAEANIVCA